MARIQVKRPFKGPTPEKVLQTVDVGAEWGEYVLGQAKKFPNRHYAVVDPVYALKDKWTPEFAKRMEEIERHGITASGQDFQGFIDHMIANGLKARHFNFDMPTPFTWNEHGDMPLAEHDDVPLVEQYGLKKFFANAHKLFATSNGRVWFASEHAPALEEIQKMARAHGFKVGKVVPYAYRDKKQGGQLKPVPYARLRTQDMRLMEGADENYLGSSSQPLYRLQLTYVKTKHRTAGQ